MATFDRNNVFQTDLFEKAIQRYLLDYRNVTSFSKFIGGVDSPIYTKSQGKGDGDRIIFPLRQTFDPRVVRGNAQMEGNEQELTYVTDSVEIGRLRWSVRLTDEQFMSIQTKAELTSDVRADLLAQGEAYNTKRIVSQFALAFNGPAYDVNQDFSYSELTARMLAANLDTANSGTSRSRVLIGNNYLATHANFTAE
jgi:hypothetical protein